MYGFIWKAGNKYRVEICDTFDYSAAVINRMEWFDTKAEAKRYITNHGATLWN